MRKATRVRSRLEEFTLGIFNVRKAAVKGIKPCAVKGCDVIELQKAKRDGIKRNQEVCSGYMTVLSRLFLFVVTVGMTIFYVLRHGLLLCIHLVGERIHLASQTPCQKVGMTLGNIFVCFFCTLSL